MKVVDLFSREGADAAGSHVSMVVRRKTGMSLAGFSDGKMMLTIGAETGISLYGDADTFVTIAAAILDGAEKLARHEAEKEVPDDGTTSCAASAR